LAANLNFYSCRLLSEDTGRSVLKMNPDCEGPSGSGRCGCSRHSEAVATSSHPPTKEINNIGTSKFGTHFH